MGRRVQVNGQWVEAPDAPVLPAPQTPAAAPPGEARLKAASAVLAGLSGKPFPASAAPPQQNAPVSVDQSGLTAFGGGESAAKASPSWRSPEDLETARRRAFLDGSDSMAGLKAARQVLSDEVKARGGDVSGGGSIPSMKFLEGQLAKLGPAPGIKTGEGGAWEVPDTAEGEAATLRAMAFNGQEGTAKSTPNQIAENAFDPATPQLAPSGNLPQAAVNAWMQTGLREKLQASQLPFDQVAQWQVMPQPLPALRQEPGREQMLAAFAAKGEQAPTTEGEALLAVGAGNAFGGRGGQFKPGNTVNLGFLNPESLPPLNSSGHYSSYTNPGNLF